MTASATDIRDRVPAVRTPHTSHTGLWAALVTRETWGPRERQLAAEAEARTPAPQSAIA